MQYFVVCIGQYTRYSVMNAVLKRILKKKSNWTICIN